MKNKILLVVAFATVTTGKLFAERNHAEHFNFNNAARSGGHQQNNGGGNGQNNGGGHYGGNGQNNNGWHNGGNQNNTGGNAQNNAGNGGYSGSTHYHSTNGQTPPAPQPQAHANFPAPQNNGGYHNDNHQNWGRGDNYGGGNWSNHEHYGGGYHEHRNWGNTWYANNYVNHNHYGYFNGRQFYLNYNCSIYPTFGYDIYAVDEQTFCDFMYALSNQDFESYKEDMALDFVRNNYLNSNQVYAILQQFDFENNRLCVAKTAFRNVIDKQNFYEVFDEFTFDNSKYQLYQMMNYGG